MSDTAQIIGAMSTVAVAFAWTVWVLAVNIRRSRTTRHVTDLQSRLLDRFASSQELITFFEGESGRRFFSTLEWERRDPMARILGGVQLGVVLMLLGGSIALLLGTQDDAIIRRVLLLTGVPCLALGAGFLISAIISHRLSKSWGLLEKRDR